MNSFVVFMLGCLSLSYALTEDCTEKMEHIDRCIERGYATDRLTNCPVLTVDNPLGPKATRKCGKSEDTLVDLCGKVACADETVVTEAPEVTEAPTFAPEPEAVLLSGGKPTSQSTTREGGGAASRAVDGNTSGQWGDDSCTHTTGSSDNWWELDLQGTARVSSVTIFNRLGCCQERLNGAQVFVGDHLCGEIVYSAGQVSYEVDCGRAEGVTVRVVQDSNILTLCEVQVYGWNMDVLLSGGKPTSQSTTREGGGAASRAVDGNTSGQWGDDSCTHTTGSSGNWWELDLEGTARVSSVTIFNRLGCCQERLDGAQVFVGDHLCGEIVYSAGQVSYQVDCGRVEGATVRVVQDNNILTLCEVQVYGSWM